MFFCDILEVFTDVNVLATEMDMPVNIDNQTWQVVHLTEFPERPESFKFRLVTTQFSDSPGASNLNISRMTSLWNRLYVTLENFQESSWKFFALTQHSQHYNCEIAIVIPPSKEPVDHEVLCLTWWTFLHLRRVSHLEYLTHKVWFTPCAILPGTVALTTRTVVFTHTACGGKLSHATATASIPVHGNLTQTCIRAWCALPKSGELFSLGMIHGNDK